MRWQTFDVQPLFQYGHITIGKPKQLGLKTMKRKKNYLLNLLHISIYKTIMEHEMMQIHVDSTVEFLYSNENRFDLLVDCLNILTHKKEIGVCDGDYVCRKKKLSVVVARKKCTPFIFLLLFTKRLFQA